MDKISKTKAEAAAEREAAAEKDVTPTDILQELEPLLKEYYIGNFRIEGQGIDLSFANGNRFRLTVVSRSDCGAQ